MALNSTNRPDFGLLQRRGRLTKKREIERAAEKIPVHYMLFDVLHTAEHGDVTDLSYTQRRELLMDLAESGQQVQAPDDLGEHLDHAMEVSQELKLEGIIAKRAESKYRPGKRSEAWIKIKHENHADVTVIGWRQGKGGRAKTFGSLLLGIEDDDGTLTYAGRVGTGFSDADLTDLRAQLEKLVRKTPPVDDVPAEDAGDATWVTEWRTTPAAAAEWLSRSSPPAPSSTGRGWRGRCGQWRSPRRWPARFAASAPQLREGSHQSRCLLGVLLRRLW